MNKTVTTKDFKSYTAKGLIYFGDSNDGVYHIVFENLSGDIISFPVSDLLAIQ